MRKVITIDIPKPCHENWDKMTPEDKGRHCNLCKKTVFDFTSKTDEQIVVTFQTNNNLCGRFKTNQLKRELVFSRKEKNHYATFLASGLFAFLGLTSNTLHAQGEPKIVQTDSENQNHIIGKIAKPNLKNDSIKGTVIDETKLPLPGVNVLIKGTSVGTVTDFDGNFTIQVKEGNILVLSYIGFKSKEVLISKNTNYKMVLELEEDIMGELITVGGAISVSTDYVCSPEELLERKKLRELSKQNYFKFYQRQYKEHREKIKNGEIERTNAGKFLFNITHVFRKKNNKS